MFRKCFRLDIGSFFTKQLLESIRTEIETRKFSMDTSWSRSKVCAEVHLSMEMRFLADFIFWDIQ